MSRRASSPDGKLTKHLDVMISEDMEESLIVLAKIKGYQNRSEYVRELVHRHIYGELDALKMALRDGVANQVIPR